MLGNELATERLDARYHEAHAVLGALLTDTGAPRTAIARSELASLRKRSARVRQRLADLKLHATAHDADDWHDLEVAVRELEDGLTRFRGRYVAARFPLDPGSPNAEEMAP